MVASSRSRTARKPTKKPTKKIAGVSKRKSAVGSLPTDVAENFLRMMSTNPTSANWLSYVNSGDAEGLLRCEQTAARMVKSLQMGGKNDGRGGLFVAGENPRSRDHFRRVVMAVGDSVKAMSVINPQYAISSFQATARYCTALKTLTLTSEFFELKIPLGIVLGQVGKRLTGLSITCRALVEGDVDAVRKCTKLEELTLVCGQIAAPLGGIWSAVGRRLRKLRVDSGFGLSYGTSDSFNYLSLDILAEKCRNLQELSLATVPDFGAEAVARSVIELAASLRLLDLRSCIIPPNVLRHIVAVCPNLRFRLHDDLGTWPAVLDAVGDNADAVLVGVMSLSRLDGWGPLGLLRAGRSCTKISKLEVDQHVTDVQLRTLFDTPKAHLKSVGFQHGNADRCKSILEILHKHVPKLESLSIRGGLPEMDTLAQLGKKFKHLTAVSLTNVKGGSWCRCRPNALLSTACNFGALAEALMADGSVCSVEFSCDYACTLRYAVDVGEFRASASAVKSKNENTSISICGYHY